MSGDLGPAPRFDVRPRFVVDPGLFISALIAPRGPQRRLLDMAFDGRYTLIVSPAWTDELTEVLLRPKFRRYFTVEQAKQTVNALNLLGDHHPDPPLEHRQPVCRDPDDEYLFALAEATEATFLISGDKDVLSVTHGLVTIRNTQGALDALAFQHPWTEHAVPAGEEEIWRRTTAEGNDLVLQMASTFTHALRTRDLNLLAMTTTPESFPMWVQRADWATALLDDRGYTSRPEYPAPDVAYVRWVPDSGQNLLITAEVELPDVVMMTMVRRADLTDHFGLGSWRTHHLGRPAAVDELGGQFTDPPHSIGGEESV